MQIHFHPRAAVLPNRLWQAMLQRLNPRMTLITTNDKIFELQVGETLLDGLERTGHEVEYQCRSGYCGPNEVLPCCCRVSGPIEIDCHARVQERDLFDGDLFES